MSELRFADRAPSRWLGPAHTGLTRPEPSSLADVLERVLDKGIVIAGDIKVDLVDVELLTIRVRLLIASVDRAREMGIDWWEHDPMLVARRQREQVGSSPDSELASANPDSEQPPPPPPATDHGDE